MEFNFKGSLRGHNGWVTAIVPVENQGILVTASRDKTIIVWKLQQGEQQIAVPVRSLKGHSHFVQDVAVSSDGYFAISGAWDNTLRLWSLTTGQSTKLFVGHKREVTSVAFSPDSRQIASSSRDGTVKIWNTVGECKFTGESHRGWVTKAQFIPNREEPTLISVGWDAGVKIWNESLKTVKHELVGHNGTVNALAVSQDGAYAASGGKDKNALVWDLTAEAPAQILSLDVNDTLNALAFSPNKQFLVAGTESGLRVWKISDGALEATVDLSPKDDATVTAQRLPACVSLAWSADSATLYAGFNDNSIRVWALYNN